MSIKVLDCTLRDGGYLVNSEFGDEVIKDIIRTLYRSNVDIIECGFLKDEPHKGGSTIFNCVSQISPYLPEERFDCKSSTSFVALADYSRYNVENLKPFDGKSIDGIRECFFKHEINEALKVAYKIKDKGYKVYIQPVDILGYSDLEILELIKKVNKLKPYAFSIVDTFGSMFKEDLERVFMLINNNLSDNIKVGFHSHNNMQLSFALSQEIINLSFGKRDVIIDSTLCGMGRGAGNTNTELLINYINSKFKGKYDLKEVLELIDKHMVEIYKKCTWGYSIPYFIAGVHNSHVHNISYLLEKENMNSNVLYDILKNVDPLDRKKYDYDNLDIIYKEYIDKSNDFTCNLRTERKKL